MKVPHRELERFRRNPREWVSRKLQAPPFKGMRIQNELALRMAVHWLHKGHTLEEATRKLEYYARKDFNLEARYKVMQRLAAYERWHRRSGRIVSLVKLGLPAWDSAPLILGGSVDRVDLIMNSTQRMQGILLGRHTRRWRVELRMPLVQHALAVFLGWPIEEVAVGVQLIDGSAPEVQHYSIAEISEALEEFGSLRSQAGDLL